jgi:hypothetical protein
LTLALQTFAPRGDRGSFTVEFSFSDGGAVPDDGREHRVDEIGAEVGGQGVFETPAAGAVTDEALKVPLVGVEPEGQLPESQALVGPQIVLDVSRHPVAPGGNVAVLVHDPEAHLVH